MNEALRARADEVERVTRAKSEFLATMSHEIRTPLNAMLGMLELLSLNTLSAQQQRTLVVVAEAGQSLLRIIDDVLDFSKIEADRLELRREAASVARIVREICSVHEGVASAKGLVLAAAVDPALAPALYLDPVRLRQILNNFVGNAVKFTRQGKVDVRIDVLATGDRTQELRFAVEDTGPGITAAEQERLFQPFVQVGPVGSRTEGGTGLGLVIARRLAQLMGGSVAMTSTPGQGTTMELRLALEIAPAELLPPDLEQQIDHWRRTLSTLRPAPTVAEAAAEGTLVLVVDDHPSNRMLLQQQLATLGYAAECAEDGAQALRHWQTGRFDLVLTDCQMAGMDGYELAARIRREEAERKLPRTPVLACTAMAVDGEAQRCAAAGMDGVLVKPLRLQEVFDAVRRWLPVAPGVPARSRPERGSGPAAPVIDTAVIQSMWGVDAARVGPIIAAYRHSAADDRAALHAAVDRRDGEGVAHSAHRMLGASKMVGAHAMAEACQILLTEARGDKWDAVAKALEAFEAEYARVTGEGAS